MHFFSFKKLEPLDHQAIFLFVGWKKDSFNRNDGQTSAGQSFKNR